MRDAERNRQESLEELNDNIEPQLEKGDLFAITLSGCLTVGIPAVIIIGLIILVTILLFR